MHKPHDEYITVMPTPDGRFLVAHMVCPHEDADYFVSRSATHRHKNRAVDLANHWAESSHLEIR